MKSKFAQLYEDADSFSETINRITKTETNIEPIRKILITLGKVKTYIVDYLDTIYNSTSYIDNFTNYIKFLMIFKTVGNILDEVNKSEK